MCDVVAFISIGLLAYLVGRMDRGQSEAMYGVGTNAYVWECDYVSVDDNTNVNGNVNANEYGYDNVNVNGYDNVVAFSNQQLS